MESGLLLADRGGDLRILVEKLLSMCASTEKNNRDSLLEVILRVVTRRLARQIPSRSV
jgi:hypothetical protein